MMTTANGDGQIKTGVIRVENLFKSFKGGQEQVLKGINLEFSPGKLTYILGSSGSGKSVLLKHILGLMKPDRGSIWIDGEDINQLNRKRLSQVRLKFGMLFQNSALFDDLTVFDNVAFPLYEHTSLSDKEILDKVKKALTHLGMSEGLDKFPNELSGGMKKRVAIARAIIREPSILLYDEPTTGLDPITRITVDELIETLKRELGLTSLVISHDVASALLLADQIAFLQGGQFVFSGTSEEFRKSDHPAIKSYLDAERRSLAGFGMV
jgi:phospholipid/cholesterol/gamma-HCH transport system ATP-binding protein